MQLSSEELLPVSREVAWRALNDPEILGACIPGCESIIASGENQYEVEVSASIGPVKAKFKGKMLLTDIRPPESYTIQFEGQGGAAGHAKGSAQVRLEVIGEDKSRLVYGASAQVGGKIAQIGSRLIDMAAQKMAADFFATFNARFQSNGNTAESDLSFKARAAARPGTFWRRLSAWLRGVLGG